MTLDRQSGSLATASSSPLESQFQDALRHHRAGRLAEAEGLYRQVLAADSRHSQSLQLLGIIAHQVGRYDAAVDLIGQAIALRGNEPAYHVNMGLALKSQGKLKEAVESYDRALSLRPDLAEAHNNRAVALSALGKLDEAVATCERALVHRPDFAEAHSNRGDALGGLGRLDEAVASYDRALALNPALRTTHVLRGNALMMRGRFEEALAGYERAIALRADDADACAGRADALYGQRRLEEALAGYDRVLALDPGRAAALLGRGKVLNDLGRAAEALASYDSAILLDPQLTAAHYNRANLLRSLGEHDRAINAYDRVLLLEPDFVEAHYDRGIALKSRGSLEAAVASFDCAIARRADYAEAHAGRADALHSQRELDEALIAYERTLALHPGFAAAHCNKGNVLNALGRSEEALASYDRAIAIDPELADAHNNRANILHALGEHDQAIAAFDRAIALNPDFAPAHFNRGNAFLYRGKMEAALASYNGAIAVKPDYVAAHANRGVALRNLGLLDDAIASFDRALALEPDSFEYACLSKLSSPIIVPSANHIEEQRTRCRKAISDLMGFPSKLEAPAPSSAGFAFYLAYHDVDDRSILEALCALLRAKARSLTFEASDMKEWTPPRGKRRVRIGVASEFFRRHTIGKLYIGLIEKIDRSRFEIVLIHSPQTERDAVSDRFDGIADKVLTLPPSLAEQQHAVAKECLDVLFYPDIGMSRDTYFLAFARLAPVQAVSWGHPSTTGLDTIDYFVSADSVEPAGAELHYTERLVRLSRLPSFYDRPSVSQCALDRSELGLPASGTLYGCPQSLFKFHPEFDAILAEIARSDPEGHIVAIEGGYPTWTGLLRERWAQSHPSLLTRVHFLPRQPNDRFMALMAHIDVLLDPIHFGSGNTLYEAMALGTPVVTWPGRFMRGRIVAGAYRQMGIADAPIAKTLQEYAPLALALGRNPAYRQQVRQALLEGSARLFADLHAVREFEAFVENAVEAAGHHTMLPPGWRPETPRPASA